MNDQSRKLVCRTTFIMLCLVPTGFQLWTLSGPYVQRLWVENGVTLQAWAKNPGTPPESLVPDHNKVSNNKASENRDSQTDKGLENHNALGTNALASKARPLPENRGKLSPEENENSNGSRLPSASPWIKEQEIPADLIAQGTVARLEIDKLPPGHWLSKLPIKSLRVTEMAQTVFFEIDQLNCDLDWLSVHVAAMTVEPMKSILAKDSRNRLVVHKMTITNQTESGQVVKSSIRGLEVAFDQDDPGRLVVSGRIIAGNELLFESVELPFKMTVDRSVGQDAIELVGHSIPVWLVNPSMLVATGDVATLSGRYKQTTRKDQGSVTEFSGTIHDVDCSSLTSAFHSESRILATGQCQLFVSKLILKNNNLAVFEGEIQSMSSGEIASAIASLLGSGTRWVGEQTVRPFRSFHLVLNYLNQQLQIRSKYQGKLIWGSSGEEILLSQQE